MDWQLKAAKRRWGSPAVLRGAQPFGAGTEASAGASGSQEKLALGWSNSTGEFTPWRYRPSPGGAVGAGRFSTDRKAHDLAIWPQSVKNCRVSVNSLRSERENPPRLVSSDFI